jgi:V8-like Glu-specific endopeptidase
MPFLCYSSLALDLTPKIVRILVKDKKGETCVGTGFFIENDLVVTCAHVLLLDTDLRSLLKKLGRPKDSKKALRDYFKKNVASVFIEHSTGKKERVTSTAFNGFNDVGLLKIKAKTVIQPLKTGASLPLGSDIFFGGYQCMIQTKNVNNPFAVLKGSVATYTRVQNAGYGKNKRIVIQGTMLGGASGSPVFSQEDGKLVGMMNGYMHWGVDKVMRAKGKSTTKPRVEDLYIPIPIAFATPIEELVKEVEKLKGQL